MLIPQNLEDLNFSGNESNDMSTIISYVIPISKKLKKLNISNCNIDYYRNSSIPY